MIALDSAGLTDERRLNTYELLDAVVVPKDPELPCEDAVVLTDSHVVVVDGMTTGFGQNPARQPSAGFVAAQCVAEAALALAPEATVLEAVQMWTDALADEHRNHSDVLFGASLVCLSIHRREVWRVGDCHFRVAEKEFYGEKLVDQANAAYRAAINHGRIASGMALDSLRHEDPGRQATAPLLATQRSLANHDGPYGYGVLNGISIPHRFIERVAVGAGRVGVTMMSDGYFVFGRDLADAENELAAALSRDPACINELARMAKTWKPGSNGPDDRTYVRVALAP